MTTDDGSERTMIEPIEGLSFRQIEEDDRELLARIYATTRDYEMAVVPWTDEQKEIFLRQQFEAQHAFYMEQFAGADFQLVLVEDEPVGRLYVERREDEIRLIDIALLPEHRGKGLGGYLLRRLLAEGEAAGLPVRIHVEQFNPAMRLYLRLGFRPIEEQGPYHLMEWTPPKIR